MDILEKINHFTYIVNKLIHKHWFKEYTQIKIKILKIKILEKNIIYIIAYLHIRKFIFASFNLIKEKL